MRTILALGVCSLLFGAHCLPLRGAPPVPREPPDLYLDQVRYDGHSLAGRLLVRAHTPFVVDRRLIENHAVGIADLQECATGAKLSPLVADILPPPARNEDFLELGAGEWFGREVRFLLFSEPFEPSRGPDCIAFELVLTAPGSNGPLATFEGQIRQVSPAEAGDAGETMPLESIEAAGSAPSGAPATGSGAPENTASVDGGA